MFPRAMLFALETANKIGLALMGGAFITFALVSSFVLPRRNPNFPGRGLRWYVVISVAFFVAMMASILILAKEPAAETGGETETAQPAEGGGGGGAAPTGDATAGKTLFTSSGCGACHVFAPAGSTGTVGPDLDKLPEFAQTANRGSLAEFTHESIVEPDAYVEKGYAAGTMPPKGGASISDEQVNDLVAFLTQGK
jgi:cytochrome c551/c552